MNTNKMTHRHVITANNQRQREYVKFSQQRKDILDSQDQQYGNR